MSRGRKTVPHVPRLHEPGRRDQLLSLFEGTALQACSCRQEGRESRRSRPDHPQPGARQRTSAAIQPETRAVTNLLSVVREQLGVGTDPPVVMEGDHVRDTAPLKDVQDLNRKTHKVLNMHEIGAEVVHRALE